jgi:hypothetical protein
MRLTAERLLSEADRGDALYVQGEVGNQTLMPPALTQRRTHHLYCSPHSIGADRLGAELNELFRRRSGKDRRGRRSVADAAPLKVTTSFAELEQCEHMLVYLTSATWTTAEGSVQYAREVAHAQRLGVHLLLVHEFPSAMDEPGNPRGACDFNDFWNEGWTPKHLLTGEANVYKQIAIALKPGAWRAAGLATVALKMGEGGGERQPIELMEEVEEAGLAAHVPAQLQTQISGHPPPRPVGRSKGSNRGGPLVGSERRSHCGDAGGEDGNEGEIGGFTAREAPPSRRFPQLRPAAGRQGASHAPDARTPPAATLPPPRAPGFVSHRPGTQQRLEELRQHTDEEPPVYMSLAAHRGPTRPAGAAIAVLAKPEEVRKRSTLRL